MRGLSMNDTYTMKINMSQLQACQFDMVASSLSKIPPMQRRRLSSIAKLALGNALLALENNTADYIVWVSQYGDEQKTFKILEDVLQGQTPSPTQFSTSVHNAVSGLYSILCEDSTPSTSLAGTWKDAVIEAYSWLKTTENKNAKVLVVYYDEPLPEIYNEQQNFDAIAMSAIFSLAQENLSLEIGYAKTEKYAALEAQAFFDFWQQQDVVQFNAWTKC